MEKEFNIIDAKSTIESLRLEVKVLKDSKEKMFIALKDFSNMYSEQKHIVDGIRKGNLSADKYYSLEYQEKLLSSYFSIIKVRRKEIDKADEDIMHATDRINYLINMCSIVNRRKEYELYKNKRSNNTYDPLAGNICKSRGKICGFSNNSSGGLVCNKL